MSDVRLDGDDDDSPEMDELAHETLEQIAAEVRQILCPVHGTPAKTIIGNGGITVETCCEELDDAIDAAFPEGDEEDPDAEPDA